MYKKKSNYGIIDVNIVKKGAVFYEFYLYFATIS